MKSETARLTFSAPRTVRYGKQSAVLSRVEFSLLSYLSGKGEKRLMGLERHVWGKCVSHDVLTRVIRSVSYKLLIGRIPLFPLISGRRTVALYSVPSWILLR